VSGREGSEWEGGRGVSGGLYLGGDCPIIITSYKGLVSEGWREGL
jgi:hypothetical protein